MKREISKSQLGESYSVATQRTHTILTDFYESLFNHLGDPKEDPKEVANLISSVRQQINLEFDLIKSASYQYNESNYGSDAKQEGLFGIDGKGS